MIQDLTDRPHADKIILTLEEAAEYLPHCKDVRAFMSRTTLRKYHKDRGSGIPVYQGREIDRNRLQREGVKLEPERWYAFRCDIDRYITFCTVTSKGVLQHIGMGRKKLEKVERVELRYVYTDTVDDFTLRILAREVGISPDDRAKTCGGISTFLRRLAKAKREEWRKDKPQLIAELSSALKMPADRIDRPPVRAPSPGEQYLPSELVERKAR